MLMAIDRWTRRRVLVVGDLMLDRYSYGNAERLSPDAPVPILAIEKQEQRPGGAANVCLDLLALDCDVDVVGIVGDDEAGSALCDAMEQAGCNTDGVIATDQRPTTVKHSYIGLAQHRHAQKMFRVDHEDRQPIDDALESRIVASVAERIAQADVLCIEDYDKGALTHQVCRLIIVLASQANVPVLVDPAAISDYSKYQGATTITPNRIEALRALGQPEVGDLDTSALEKTATTLRTQLELDTVVLTADRHGAFLVTENNQCWLPARARKVYDVTGAGDMVLAVLAGAIANGCDWQTAVRLANVAAGLEVERFGIVPIPLSQVLLGVLADAHDSLGKQRSLEDLAREVAAHRQAGRTIAMTNGCFDILHAGHVAFLREARTQGDLLVVALNTDDSIRQLKGDDRPVNSQDDRVLVLGELQSVDYIVLFDQDTPIDVIQAIKPDVLIKGADYTRETVVGHEIVEAHGGRVHLVPLVAGRSTTNIIAKARRE